MGVSFDALCFLTDFNTSDPRVDFKVINIWFYLIIMIIIIII